MIDFFETTEGVKGVVEKNNGDYLSIICQGVPGTRVEGRNFLTKLSKNMIGSDVIRFEPRGMGYSEGDFYKLTHESWLKDIRSVLNEIFNYEKKYKMIIIILMSDSAKLIVNIVDDLLKKFCINMKWKIILINGILMRESTSGPQKTRVSKTNDNSWALYTGFGVLFSLDFLYYYPEKNKVIEIIQKNKNSILGIYGMNDNLTYKTRLFLDNKGIKIYKIKNGDHLFTNKYGMENVFQAIKEIYSD